MTCGGAAVAGIIPRWEWRTFGPGLGAAEAAFAGLVPGRVEEVGGRAVRTIAVESEDPSAVLAALTILTLGAAALLA